MSEDLETRIARGIAFAGLGTANGAHRAMPESWGDEDQWRLRILECIPAEAERRCRDLAKYIVELAQADALVSAVSAERPGREAVARKLYDATPTRENMPSRDDSWRVLPWEEVKTVDPDRAARAYREADAILALLPEPAGEPPIITAMKGLMDEWHRQAAAYDKDGHKDEIARAYSALLDRVASDLKLTISSVVHARPAPVKADPRVPGWEDLPLPQRLKARSTFLIEHCKADDATATLLRDYQSALDAKADTAAEGWVLVPREPTPEMIYAGGLTRDVLRDPVGETGAENAYRAMIAAAPPPTEGAEQNSSSRSQPCASAGRDPRSPWTLDESIARGFPGGVVDYSTFEALEEALDKADAPIRANGRFMTLVERIMELAGQRDAVRSSVASAVAELEADGHQWPADVLSGALATSLEAME